MSGNVDEHDAPRPYQLSGELGKLGWLPAILMLLLIVGALAGVINGFVAQYMSTVLLGYRICFFVAVFMECFFSLMLGACCVGLGKAMHCRNIMLVEVLGFFQVLVALYFLSAVYVGESLYRSGVPRMELPYLDLFLHPALLYTNLSYIFNASGNSLLITSTIHMAALFFPSFFMTRVLMKDQIYCEHCKAWIDQYDPPSLKFTVPNSSPTMQRLYEGDLSALEGAPSSSSNKPPYLRVTYVTCKSCGITGTYCISHIEPNPDNPHTPTTDPITEPLELSPKAAVDLQLLKNPEGNAAT